MDSKQGKSKANITSMGYHTFNIFHKLTVYEGDTLLNDALNCQKNTGEIRVRPLMMNDDDWGSGEFTEKLKSGSRYFLIEYTTKHKGLSWLLRLSPKSPGFITMDMSAGDEDRPCSIKARINPKLFTGIRDYLSASSAVNMEGVEERFNLEATKISPLLGSFDDYEFNRIDYCVNFALRELGIDCDPLLIMELFQRSNIPKHFYRPLKPAESGLSPFSGEAASFASLPADEPDRNTFVLTSDSININCYYKYNQLRNEFIDCPNIGDATDVIRFEVQCLYQKSYYLSKAIRNRDGFTNLFSEMLSDDTSSGIINNYFDKIIRRGDYYSMDEAIKKIQSHQFTMKKEARLINVLKNIERCGGIRNVKASLGEPEIREDFRRSLRELAAIRINPVTIPEKYKIAHIPNLLDAYYKKLAEERDKKRETEMKMEMLNEFFSKKSHKLLRRQILG